MLAKHDLKAISSLLDEKLDRQTKSFDEKLGNLALSFDEKLEKQTKSFDEKLGRQTKSFDEKLGRQTKSFDEKLGKMALSFDEKLRKQTEEILKGVAQFLRDALIPILDKHEERLEHLEGHIKHPPGNRTS